jgi:Rrf2 family protein
MRMSDGVEWTAHACALLAVLPEGKGLSAATLAELNDLPPAYMAKHMQALTKAGVTVSLRGAGGGYRLARPAAEINLWDIVEAIEGKEPAFRCTEIRQKGPCASPPKDCKHPCQIASAFHAAEHAWRSALREATLADILADLARKQTPARRAELQGWLQTKL